jgi:Protein of unknown function (DUF2939)
MRALLLILFLAVAGYLAYPYYTLYRIDRALLDDDAKTLEELVDFASIRGDIAGEITGDILAKAGEAKEEHPIIGGIADALAKRLAPDIVAKKVDEKVSAQMVLNNPTVIEHRKKDESFVDFITYAFFMTPTKFKVDLKDPETPKSPTVTAILELVGYKWRAVAVELPPGVGM